MWFWIVPLLLGIFQVPWLFFWIITTLGSESGQPVLIMQDSIVWMVAISMTLFAIISSGYGLFRGYKTRTRVAIVVCPLVLLVSIFLLATTCNEWYQDVYLYRHSNYGFWLE